MANRLSKARTVGLRSTEGIDGNASSVVWMLCKQCWVYENHENTKRLSTFSRLHNEPSTRITGPIANPDKRDLPGRGAGQKYEKQDRTRRNC